MGLGGVSLPSVSFRRRRPDVSLPILRQRLSAAAPKLRA